MSAELRDESILCLSTAAWRGLWTRKQLIMKRLSTRNRVMYVEPQLSLAYLIRSGRAGAATGAQSWRNDGPVILKPPPALPGQTRSNLVHRANLALLRRLLRRALGRAGWDPSILWFYDPSLARLAESWPSARLVYDCVDRHHAYPGRGRLLKSLERDLVERSCVVVATSRTLVRDFAPFRRDVHLIPNGVDLSLFADPSPLPPDLLPRGRPRIGFLGGIGEWVDLDLLKYVSLQHPYWWLCLAGPTASAVRLGELARRPNVRLVGRISREQIASFLREMDVCLLPFKVNPLTEAVSPLKLFEYFAAGKPVVSTPLPEVAAFGPLAAVAGSPQEFVSAIEVALSEADGLAAQREAAAREHSWSVLLPRLEAVVARTVGDSC
jgi:glycosyltransferase involved in cell wall biosynthesis